MTGSPYLVGAEPAKEEIGVCKFSLGQNIFEFRRPFLPSCCALLVDIRGPNRTQKGLRLDRRVLAKDFLGQAIVFAESMGIRDKKGQWGLLRKGPPLAAATWRIIFCGQGGRFCPVDVH